MVAIAPPTASAPRLVRPGRTRRVVAVAIVVAVVVEAVVFRHHIVRAVNAIGAVDVAWLGLAVVAALVSMNCFARTQRCMLLAGGARVPFIRMIALTYTANAINWTFPGGTALSAGYVVKRLRLWGASVPAASFAVLASGVLSSVSFVALALGGSIAAGSGSSVSVLGGGAAIGVLAAAATALWRHPGTATEWIARSVRRLNRLARRDPDRGLPTLRRFVGELMDIKPRPRDWLMGAGFAMLNWLTDLVCLLASCRAVDADHSTVALLVAAYVAGTTASSISFVPGGFGVIDLAMVLVLSGGGVSSTAATAGVVLYRLISCVLVVLVGWLVWVGSAGARRAAAG